MSKEKPQAIPTTESELVIPLTKVEPTVLRLPDDQYYQEEHPKKQIYIHHTVGGSAASTFEWWKKDPLKVGTAYIVERDGNVIEVFDPKYWAHHLGLKHKENTRLNKESIGIEICSEGGLTMKDGKLFCFDGKKEFTQEFVKLDEPWRGFQYFDAYSGQQISSIFVLIKILCERFGIPKRVLLLPDRPYASEANFSFNGILGHCNVRADKSDPYPLFPWNRLQDFLDMNS